MSLTRAEAERIIQECGDDAGLLRQLAEHWEIAGHWNETLQADHWIGVLYEHVEDSTIDGDRVRSYGPSGDDETCLAEPECGHDGHGLHVRGFCRVCGEPLGVTP